MRQSLRWLRRPRSRCRALDFKMKIYPTITTIYEGEWKNKIKEVNELGIEEICVFPTNIEKEERKELYKSIKESSIKKVPFVHLRSDMDIDELDFFVNEFGTEVFNIHSGNKYPLIHDYSKYKDIIFVENHYGKTDEDLVNKFAGVCIDLAHLENTRRTSKENFEYNKDLIERHRIGCVHISAIREEEREGRYDSHTFKQLSEFDYVLDHKEYLRGICAIELENSIREQLKVIDYLNEKGV